MAMFFFSEISVLIQKTQLIDIRHFLELLADWHSTTLNGDNKEKIATKFMINTQ